MALNPEWLLSARLCAVLKNSECDNCSNMRLRLFLSMSPKRRKKSDFFGNCIAEWKVLGYGYFIKEAQGDQDVVFSILIEGTLCSFLGGQIFFSSFYWFICNLSRLCARNLAELEEKKRHGTTNSFYFLRHFFLSFNTSQHITQQILLI